MDICNINIPVPKSQNPPCQYNHSRCPCPNSSSHKFCSLDCLLYHLEVTALPTLSLYRYLSLPTNEQQRRVNRLPYTWRIGTASFPSVHACNINIPNASPQPRSYLFHCCISTPIRPGVGFVGGGTVCRAIDKITTVVAAQLPFLLFPRVL